MIAFRKKLRPLAVAFIAVFCPAVLCASIVFSTTSQTDRRKADNPARKASMAPLIRNFRLNPLRTQGIDRMVSLFNSSVSRLVATLTTKPPANGEKWDYLQSYLFWLQQRSYPNDTIDWSSYIRAFAQRDLMATLALRPAPGLPPSEPMSRWEFLGPKNLPVPYRQYYGEGTTSGRVNGVAFDPYHSGTYYVATAGGGLWKTTDGGRNWTALSNSDKWMYSKLSSVSVDPVNPNTIYVGTGDFDGGRSVYGYGIMKSTDAGLNWVNLGFAQLSGYSVRRILIDPKDPRIITITAGRHPSKTGMVLRSTDSGDHWTTALTQRAEWCDLEIGAPDSAGDRYYYAVGQALNKGEVWRSSNSGVTWEKLAPPLDCDNQESLDIACSLTSAGTVYLLSGSEQRILKSTDFGSTWQDTKNNFPNGIPEIPDYNWSQHAYDCYISCATLGSQDVVYVGLVDVVASVDGGATWRTVGRSYGEDALTHNDQHCLAVNPSNPNEALVGNDGGVYLLKYAQRESTWTFDTTLNAGLGITQFYRSALHPTNPTKLLGGAQDNATPIALGEPDENAPPIFANWANIGGGDGGFCAVNPANPRLQYVTAQSLMLYRTDNGWLAGPDGERQQGFISYWDVVSVTPDTSRYRYWNDEPVSFGSPIAIDPRNPNKLYVGTNHLWRWDETRYQAENTNAAWTNDLGDKQLSVDGVIEYIAVSPSDSNRIYTGSSHGEVWMTADGGSNWKQINVGATRAASLPNYAITSIAVDPTDSNRVLVGLSGTGPHPGHLWRCSNTTADRIEWSNVSGSLRDSLPNIPLNCVVIEPDDPKHIYYVGTDVGFFLTRDGGAHWINGTVRLGLPNVQVNDLQLASRTGYLVAATFGRGFWRIKLPANVQPSNFTLETPSIADSLTIRKRVSDQLSSFGIRLRSAVANRRAGSIR